MLSQSIYFSLVALTWAFSTSNETSPFFEDQLEEFEPKGGDVPPWTQAQQGVHKAQMPSFSTVPPRIKTLGDNPAQIQRGVGAPNAQVPIAQVPPRVQGPNTSPFGPGWPGVHGQNSPPFGQGYGVQGSNPPPLGHSSGRLNTPPFGQGYGVHGPNPPPFGQRYGVQSPNTPNFGKVPPGMQGPNTYSVQQQVIQGPIPLEQLRQIFLKGGNASVAFIVYTYVNLLNKGSIGGQTTFPSYQPPPTTRSQVPGTMNRNVYPPYQNPQQPSGTINGYVYPPDQYPYQQPPPITNGGGYGYPSNRNTWSQPSQTTNQGGHGYSSYQNPYPTWKQLAQ